ncbi:hypothetical protein BKA66DRAFT_443633 [Pyrenochaeta sp. MPI-SDFR-AT-0127]|nr:hypothetical protein BKA66DRAFT_443633 [Pyrenochaeta sp. MPI-SDFR-AT-0127]
MSTNSVDSGTIAFLNSTGAEASASSPTVPIYVPTTIIVAGNPVVSSLSSPQVTAVAYTKDGQNEIRVYYIGGDGFLHELCNSNGAAEWTIGSLDNIMAVADPKAPLSASVSLTSGQLKLYYSRADRSFTWCTWVEVGAQAWSSREINIKW